MLVILSYKRPHMSTGKKGIKTTVNLAILFQDVQFLTIILGEVPLFCL